MKNKVMKVYIVIFIVFMSGCTLPTDGECIRNTRISYAHVTEVTENYIIVDSIEGVLKVNTSAFVHKGEILPAYYEYIVKGSCGASGLSINWMPYLSIKDTSISFSDDGEGKIGQGGNEKIIGVAENFLILKKDYPSARLLLYSHASVGSKEYRYNKALIWYAKIVKTKLIENGIHKSDISVVAYEEDDVIINFVKPLAKEHVIFRVTFF